MKYQLNYLPLYKQNNKAMSELKKGDLVMTLRGIAQYVLHEVGEYHEVDLITGERGICVPSVRSLTRADVEAWAYDKDYMTEYRSHKWDKQGYSVIDDPILGGMVLQPDLDKDNFDTAPAMRAEAILLAKMLNATKD